jgi:hypothetical protein
MADGRVIDAVSSDDGNHHPGNVQVYLAGVQFESSQDLSATQQHAPTTTPGKAHIVRYDPKAPANSIVV